MNKSEILKENQNIQQKIENMFNKEFLSMNNSIKKMNDSLDNYIEKECLLNTENQKEMEDLLNNLCYEFADLFNKAKLINESIIFKNNLVDNKFKDLNCKMANVPDVKYIDESINRISITTQKFYSLIHTKYKNQDTLFKIQLGFMYFTSNRILNKDLLSESDTVLFEYIDALLKLEYINYLYKDLNNILLCINCNYID